MQVRGLTHRMLTTWDKIKALLRHQGLVSLLQIFWVHKLKPFHLEAVSVPELPASILSLALPHCNLNVRQVSYPGWIGRCVILSGHHLCALPPLFKIKCIVAAVVIEAVLVPCLFIPSFIFFSLLYLFLFRMKGTSVAKGWKTCIMYSKHAHWTDTWETRMTLPAAQLSDNNGHWSLLCSGKIRDNKTR